MVPIFPIDVELEILSYLHGPTLAEYAASYFPSNFRSALSERLVYDGNSAVVYSPSRFMPHRIDTFLKGSSYICRRRVFVRKGKMIADSNFWKTSDWEQGISLPVAGFKRSRDECESNAAEA